jgi:hypothetical protein
MFIPLFRGERQKSDVSCFHDGVGQSALMRRTDTRNAAWHDLGPLWNKL